MPWVRWLSTDLRTKRLTWITMAIFALSLIGICTYRLSWNSGIHHLKQEESRRLDVLGLAIDGVVTRHASIPSAIQVNREVIHLLQAADPSQSIYRDSVNIFLQQLNNQLGGPVLFVMDTSGHVVASSDSMFSMNLLDEDLSYMPFFRSALNGIPARHYAVDPIRPEPGYFFAQPIRDESQAWRVIGVAVVQSSLRELESRWPRLESPSIIVDNNHVILLSSDEQWRYASLEPLSGEAMVDFDFRPYADRKVGLRSLGISTTGAQEGQVIELPRHLLKSDQFFNENEPYLLLSRNLPETAWRVIVFSDLRQVRVQALSFALLAVVAFGCVLLFTMILWQRSRLARSREQTRAILEHSHHELELKVKERTETLNQMIGRLKTEVSEREHAERTLREAQDELVQAAKLAVVGQMAAGMTHELAQPLNALRTLSDNAISFMKVGNHDVAGKNINLVSQLAEQMGRIIQPLKSFCRKSPTVLEAFDINQSIDAALFLFHQRIEDMHVSVRRPSETDSIYVLGDPNRVQQVLVNLIGNALDAMAGVKNRQLVFHVHDLAEHLELTISDSGPGLSSGVIEHLFEPFFTTKPVGEGLGLGLTISRDILRDFGGDLRTEITQIQGACFIVSLPKRKKAQ